MKKKRILSLLVTLTMITGLLAAFPAVSYATASGQAGPWVNWYYDEGTRTLTLSGIGSLYGYQNCTGDEDVREDVKHIIIENGVTEIGWASFKYFPSLKTVTMADSVTKIGDFAFQSCTRLTNINFSKNLKSIGRYAFELCYGLKSVKIPSSCLSIGEYAFSRCTGLEDIELYGNIGKEAFSCYPFLSTLKSVTIGGNCEHIDEDAFISCDRLTTLRLPASVKQIGECAFHSDESLTDVYYGGTAEQWKKIDIDSYLGKNQLSIYGNDPLIYCENIHYAQGGDIYFGLSWELNNGTLTIRANPQSSTIGNEQFYGNMVKWGEPEIVPWYGLRSEITSVVIEDGVKDIGDYAFYGCSNLESVTIPSSVTRICKYAFKNCFALEDLTIPDSVTRIDEGAFMNCWLSGTFTLSDSLTTIERGAFSATKFDCNIIFNDSKKSLLDDISFGGGNKSLMNNIAVFAGDPRGDCPKTSEDTVGWSVSNDTLVITGAGKMADFASASDVPWLSYRDDIKKIIIDDEVTSIGKFAFAYHRNLEEVDIMGDITEIGSYAFSYCSSLKNIYLPASVAVMSSSNPSQNGKYVFNDCTALESIDMDVYNETFRQWDGGLYDVDLKRIIQYPLGKLQEDFTLRDGIETITSRAFSGAVHLKTVTIPTSVTSIEQWAFDRCDNLTDIYYEGSESQWIFAFRFKQAVIFILLSFPKPTAAAKTSGLR